MTISEQDLLQYASGELDGDARTRVAAGLDPGSDASGYLETVEALTHAVEDLPKRRPSRDLAGQAMAHTRTPDRQPALHPWLKIAAAATIILTGATLSRRLLARREIPAPAPVSVECTVSDDTRLAPGLIRTHRQLARARERLTGPVVRVPTAAPSLRARFRRTQRRLQRLKKEAGDIPAVGNDHGALRRKGDENETYVSDHPGVLAACGGSAPHTGRRTWGNRRPGRAA